MSTRSLTHIQENGKTLVTFYRQSDGYPEGHGKELAEFLEGFQIVNGYNTTTGKIANGVGCLAAQIVAKFKEGVGNFYIYETDASDVGEEYVYTVGVAVGKPVSLTIAENDGKKLYSGSAGEVLMKLTAI